MVAIVFKHLSFTDPSRPLEFTVAKLRHIRPTLLNVFIRKLLNVNTTRFFKMCTVYYVRDRPTVSAMELAM